MAKSVTGVNNKLQKLGLSVDQFDRLLQKLPPKDVYEFMYHVFYSVEDKELENLKAYKKSWVPWNEWDYPPEDVVRFNNIIVDNQKHIKNKHVLDYASHLGYFTYFSLYYGAKHVSSRDIFQFKLNIAKTALENYKNYDSGISDVYDLEKLKKDTKDVETILFLGLVYHIHNHVEVFDIFTKSSAKTIIIDSTLSENIQDKKELPLVYYKFETSSNIQEECVNAADNKIFNSKIYVGEPTPAYIDALLSGFGWEKESYKEYTMRIDTDDPRHRFVVVYTRD